MNPLFFISAGFICIGVIYLIVLKIHQQSFGILAGKRMYQDTVDQPGDILQATSIPLIGKPDYLIHKDGVIIPVEVKTGKTPVAPYDNHTMQLMAYCFLVEETFGIRPPGGYLRYPDKEFPLQYTPEAEMAVKDLVQEILDKKQTDEEFQCTHTYHYND
jgi:CRISPR/Cas system-associated exonuclease Cas4 (RecB family)